MTTSNLNATRWAFFPGTVPLYFWILSAITGLVTVFCNVLVVVTVTRKRRLRRSKSNWLLLSLAVSDLAVGMILIPSLFTCYFTTLLHCDWDLNKSIYDIFLHISVANLCAITAERYIAVTFPLRHANLITKKSVVCLLVAAWSGPLLISPVPLVIRLSGAHMNSTEPERVFSVLQIIIFEVVPSIMMIVCYAHIFQISRKHRRNINSLRRMVVGGAPLSRSRLNRVRLTVRVFCFVVPLFIACWVLASWRELCQTVLPCTVPPHFIHISRLLLKGHSMINPIVYALHKKDIRRELVRLVSLGFGK